MEELDEETQMMASMGLPLAFVCSSEQRRAVSHTVLQCCVIKVTVFEMKAKKQLWLLFSVMSQGWRSNRSSSKYCEETSEEEESKEDPQADEKGDAIILLLLLFLLRVILQRFVCGRVSTFSTN